MTDPDDRTTAPGKDADADAGIVADVIRARLERRGIRNQDVEDAVAWARASLDPASPD